MKFPCHLPPMIAWKLWKNRVIRGSYVKMELYARRKTRFGPMTRTGWEGGCARIESKERGEGGFVGTKFFGFKFPRKLALQNYSQLPRRARNLSMVRARVRVHAIYRFSSRLCATRLKNISYLERTSFPRVHVHRVRCTNCSVHKSIDNPAGNRAVFPRTDIARAEIYVHSLEIPAGGEGDHL